MDTETPAANEPEAETEAVEEVKLDPIPVLEHLPEPDQRPKYFVVENAFHAATENGWLRIPLFFKTKAIRALPDNIDLLEQVYLLFADNTELTDALDELDIADSRTIARKLFQAYQEKQQARLGE